MINYYFFNRIICTVLDTIRQKIPKTTLFTMQIHRGSHIDNAINSPILQRTHTIQKSAISSNINFRSFMYCIHLCETQSGKVSSTHKKSTILLGFYFG